MRRTKKWSYIVAGDRCASWSPVDRIVFILCGPTIKASNSVLDIIVLVLKPEFKYSSKVMTFNVDF